MIKIFLALLLGIIVSACSLEPEAEPNDSEQEDPNITEVEDVDEIRDILEEAQAVDEEINSWSMTTNISQDMAGEEVNENIEVSISSRLMLEPLAGHIDMDSEMAAEVMNFEMYFNDDATYLALTPESDDDEYWQELIGEEHKEISESFYEESMVNYDLLLDHADEITLTLFEADYFREQDPGLDDYADLYDLSWSGDPELYHELLVHENSIDEVSLDTSAERFHFSFSFEEETYHPKNIYTSMNGITEFEGENVEIEEKMTTSISGVNEFEEGDLKVPNQVEQRAEE